MEYKKEKLLSYLMLIYTQDVNLLY